MAYWNGSPGERRMRCRARRLVGAAPLALALAAAPAGAECPQEGAILEAVAAADLSRSSRVARFATELPEGLQHKAAREPGRVVASHQGHKNFGLLVAPLPVATLWKAISDDERHVEELPIRYSEIVGGTARGEQSAFILCCRRHRKTQEHRDRAVVRALRRMTATVL